MVKKITINNSGLYKKLMVLNCLQGRNLSGIELVVLEELVQYSSGSALALTAQMTKSIRDKQNISTSAFNTSIYRLAEKGAIKKEGKTILLNPLYHNIQELTGLNIVFNPPTFP